MTIKRIMFLLLAALSILMLVGQGQLLHQAYNSTVMASYASAANKVTSALLKAAGLWAQERGVTNTALNDPNPASTETIQKITKLREASTKSFQEAMDNTSAANLMINDNYQQAIKQALEKVSALRQSVDADMSHPKTERNTKNISEWVPSITALIMETQKLRINLSSQSLTADAVLGKDVLIRHSIWLMTEYAGRERALIGGIISSDNPIAPDQLQQLLGFRGKVEEGWTILSNIALSKDEHDVFDGPMNAAKDDYFSSFEKVRQGVYADAKLGLGYNMTANAWIDRSTQAIETLLKLQNISTGSIDVFLEKERMSSNQNMLFYSVALIISIITVISALLVNIRRVIRPINSLSASMNIIAQGRLDQEVPYLTRIDEIGHMAKSVEVFRHNGIEKVRLEQQQKQAEITAQQDKKRMMQKLADNFETSVQGIIGTVAAASTELYQTAENMQKIATSVSQQSNTVATASSQTFSSVRNVSAAVEEMSTSVKEISSQITKTSSLMNEAVSKTGQADKSAQMLSSAVAQIGEILAMIEAIAGQINLLALNATIESARAGDAGKGFAVVASEVKNLANQTSKATETIAGQIKNIKEVSANVVQIVDEIRNAISHVSQYTGGIAAAVEEQSAATGEISMNMQQASEGVQNIATSIEQVSKGTSDADHAAKEVLDAAQMLSKQSEMLNTQVKMFLSEIRE